MKNICFTGHRNIKNKLSILCSLIEHIEILITDGAENFYAGGAVGFDTLAELAVLNLKKLHPDIKLHLILPYKNQEENAVLSEIIPLADSVEYVCENYEDDCMKKRNEKLIENADYCVCYLKNSVRSGTAQTVNMAKKKCISIYNLYNY